MKIIRFAVLALPAIFALSLGLRIDAKASVSVTIKEWDVPQGAFPHDPALAPNGAGWYTGQHNNTLGRVDPATGAITEFPLSIPGSGPHGLVADEAGDIWFTGNAAGYIGRLDPATGQVQDFKMPDAAARDPHTGIFDPHGILWFTVQQGNFVGRLDPVTGDVKLQAIATPRARPYGIVINSRGVPFVALFGTNKIGRIEPDTMEVREYTLPEGAHPRRIAVTSDDIIWYTDYARGFLGRLDPATGAVSETASPGGEDSRPYGIAPTPDGVLWYCETGVDPNTLVRYNPRDKSLQTWPIPSGGGVVRHMVASPDGGTLWLACSGVGKVARVTIR